MAQSFSKSFYNSKAWKSCRQAYISKRILIDGGLCQRCKEYTGYIVHHKVKLTPNNINNPDIALNHCNLEYVCKECHDREHYEDMHGTIKGALFNDSGEIIPERE